MSKPISRRELIRRFRALGWDGPYAGGKHAFMVKGSLRVRIPNPHAGDIDWSLAKRILQQAQIVVEDWERA
jgi:predicted RNA binding protein YcfA (HicA-like mRNA interferase family)